MRGVLIIGKMSMNSNKKRSRPNTFNKFNQSKGITEKNMASDGVYANSRLMHAAASLVGCIVQIQVRNGALYEGIFRTFSNQLDLVLEMPHKVDQKTSPTKSLGPAIGSLLASFPFEDGIADKLIFRLKDVVMLKATNIDLDYAVKDNFTDTAISKFNGQITERELEPWEGPTGDIDSLEDLGGTEEEGANGWDANDMFRTNAEKYGVKSSYDNSLQEYTVPLQKKNTEEYRKQEAKALKIAQEIESNMSYQSHIQLENGDEEDKFSAVVRPDGSNNLNRYLPPQRRKPMPGPGPKRPSTLPTTSPLPVNPGMPRPYSLQPSPPVGAPGSSSAAPSPSGPVVPPNQVYRPHVPPAASAPLQPPASSPAAPQSVSLPLKQSGSPPVQTSVPSPIPAPVAPASVPSVPKGDQVINGEEIEKEESSTTPVSEQMLSTACNSSKVTVLSPVISQPLPPRPERRREIERKGSKKGRDDEIEEFKKFSSNFKLSEETKEPRSDKDEVQCFSETKEDATASAAASAISKVSELKVTEKSPEQEESKPDITKISKLNPNAKEFVLNPNAKSFTPRSMAVTSPHTSVHIQQQQQPQRIHAQSPVMAVPHAQMMPGMGQPVFATMGPQYIMQATPVSMALTSPFTASITQAPRLRKVPIMQPRHDITPSMHVAAATGQPILASNPIPNPSQLTMQYTPPPGMIHAPAGPQQTMAYPQMSYVVGPRGISPQPVGMVPTSHAVSYDTSHINAHVFMPAHPSAAALSAVTAAHSMQQGAAAGQHSSQHPPQSHTPVIHPSPSPVHQPPPAHVNHSQPQTPTTVMYPGPMNQHPLPSGHHNPNQPINAHVTHHANFPAGAQPVVLMQQQALPGSHPHHSGPHPVHLHSLQNAGSHVGGPAQIMPQMTVIPTSATMVSAPNTMATSPFMPHPQGV